MGAVLEGVFVKPSALPGGADCLSSDAEYCEGSVYGLVQVLGLAAVYAGVLSHGSSLISDGAELLQVVPSLEHLVGSIVLPVLGAVPDGAIILFSGLAGDRAAAQEQLSVGVGALAGSTILLLTLPWAMSVVAGRVDLSPASGRPQYTKPIGWRSAERGAWRKLTTPLVGGLTCSGVTVQAGVRESARAMGLTALLYVMIQGPAMTRSYRSISAPVTDAEALAVARFERPYAIAALVVSLAAFFAYLAHKAAGADHDAVLTYRVEEVRIALIKEGRLTLVGAMAHLVDKLDGLERAYGAGAHNDLCAPLARLEAPGAAAGAGGAHGGPLPASVEHEEILAEIRDTLRPFFQRYDVDGSRTIDKHELPLLFADLHEKLGPMEIGAFLLAGGEAADSATPGAVGVASGGGELLSAEPALSFEQFVRVVIGYIKRRGAVLRAGAHGSAYRETEAVLLRGPSGAQAAAPGGGDDDGEGDGEEEAEADDEMPDELRDLPPDEQYARAMATAGKKLLGGTALVVLFSEPMVGVLSEIAARSGVAPFYVAFILAPVASNGAEVLSAYAFAKRKSVRATTISFSTLIGAAVMNNTFCLAVFMALIVARGDLYWEFTAETVSILIVELAMLFFASKTDHRLLDGLLVGLLYPLGLAIVVGLEAAGLD